MIKNGVFKVDKYLLRPQKNSEFKESKSYISIYFFKQKIESRKKSNLGKLMRRRYKIYNMNL